MPEDGIVLGHIIKAYVSAFAKPRYVAGYVRLFDIYIGVNSQINVCEAMGANIANTVAEGIAPILEELTHGRVGLKILTNLCKKRVTKCSFRLPLDQLKWKGVEGRYCLKTP